VTARTASQIARFRVQLLRAAFRRADYRRGGLWVALGILAVAVFPTRRYLDQRHELAAATRRIQILDRTNAALQQRVGQLGTDAEVERLAREQHNLVKPGEEAFAILPAGAAAASPPGVANRPAPDVSAAPSPVDQRSFWVRLRDRLSFWD